MAMLSRKKKFYQSLSFAADILVGVTLLQLLFLFLYYFSDVLQPHLTRLTGYPFNLQGMQHLDNHAWLFPVILLCLFLSLQLNRFYAMDLFVSKTKLIIASMNCCLIGLGATTIFFYIFSVFDINRSLLVGFYASFFVYLASKEIIYRRILIYSRCHVSPLKAVLVCEVTEVVSRLKELGERELSSVCVEHICLLSGDVTELPEALQKRVIGGIEKLSKFLSQEAPDIVFLTDDRHSQIPTHQIIEIAEEQGVEVWYFADFLEPLLARPQFDDFGGEPVIVFSTVPHYEGRFVLKRLLDVFGSILLMLVCTPLFVLIAIGIKMTSQGPVFFQQQRTGWRGRTFNMFKFRTMAVGDRADPAQTDLQNEMSGPVFKTKNDPRVTRLGAFLRKYSLDELPQIFNVFKGEMSLVGPRPLPIYETEKFECFKDRRRLSVLPGITGLWQVSGRSELKNFSEWVQLDLEYIDRWSIWLDVRILFMTIPVVLLGHGAY